MRMTEKEYEALVARSNRLTEPLCRCGGMATKQGTALPAKRGNPNKTEQEYANRLAYEFPGCAIRFEAISLRMSNGHVYTPDLVVLLPDNSILFVEVKARGKNGYRQPSYQRAKLAYDQCRVEYPMFQFRWAEKSGGKWL